MTIQDEIKLIDNLFVDWCSFLNHEPTRITYNSGEALWDAFVDTSDNSGNIVVTHIALVEVLSVYIETHFISVIDNSISKMYADDFYRMILKHIRAMGIEEFYIPIMVLKRHKKSSFNQFLIVEVPREYQTNDMLDLVTKMVHDKTFVGVAPDTQKSAFQDDPEIILKNYISLLVRLITMKSLRITTYEINTSD